MTPDPDPSMRNQRPSMGSTSSESSLQPPQVGAQHEELLWSALWSRVTCQYFFPDKFLPLPNSLSIAMNKDPVCRGAAAAVIGTLLQEAANNAENAVRGVELDRAHGSSDEEGVQVIQMVGGEGDDLMSESEEDEQVGAVHMAQLRCSLQLQLKF